MFCHEVIYIKTEFILYILQPNINYYNYLLLHKMKVNSKFYFVHGPIA